MCFVSTIFLFWLVAKVISFILYEIENFLFISFRLNSRKRHSLELEMR